MREPVSEDAFEVLADHASDVLVRDGVDVLQGQAYLAGIDGAQSVFEQNLVVEFTLFVDKTLRIFEQGGDLNRVIFPSISPTAACRRVILPSGLTAFFRCP